MAFLSQILSKTTESLSNGDQLSSKMDGALHDTQRKGLYFHLVGGTKMQGKDASKGKGR